MKEERLNELLNKFYSGNSTLGEEEELRLFFLNPETNEKYQAEKDIFQGYSALIPTIEAGAGLSDKIISAVNKSDNLHGKSLSRRMIILSGSAAAILVIAAGLYFMLPGKNEKIADTYSDPGIAYVEAMKVLNDVSVKLNKGTKALKPIGKFYASANESIRKVEYNTEKINSGLEKLGVLEKLRKGSQK